MKLNIYEIKNKIDRCEEMQRYVTILKKALTGEIIPYIRTSCDRSLLNYFLNNEDNAISSIDRGIFEDIVNDTTESIKKIINKHILAWEKEIKKESEIELKGGS